MLQIGCPSEAESEIPLASCLVASALRLSQATVLCLVWVTTFPQEIHQEGSFGGLTPPLSNQLPTTLTSPNRRRHHYPYAPNISSFSHQTRQNLILPHPSLLHLQLPPYAAQHSSGTTVNPHYEPQSSTTETLRTPARRHQLRPHHLRTSTILPYYPPTPHLKSIPPPSSSIPPSLQQLYFPDPCSCPHFQSPTIVVLHT